MKNCAAKPGRTIALAGVIACLTFAPAALKAEPAIDEVIGQVLYYTVRAEDTLPKVARAFDVGIQAVRDANKKNKAFKAGDTLVLPTAHVLPPVRHEGIVINLAELRLYLFSPDAAPRSFPISIGKEGWETPRGETTIVKKRTNPIWIPTPALREEDPDLPLSIPPGPDNPLGAFALNLGWPGFAIHGTNLPETIGRRISHGCIRMYPEDIHTLFNAVQPGTKVTIIQAPYKLGWEDNTLFLEVSPSRRLARQKHSIPLSAEEIHEAVRQKAGSATIFPEAVARAVKSRDGIPVPVAAVKTASRSSNVIRISDLTGGKHD